MGKIFIGETLVREKRRGSQRWQESCGNAVQSVREMEARRAGWRVSHCSRVSGRFQSGQLTVS